MELPVMAKAISVNGERFVVMIGERRIRKRVKEIARRISREYRGKTPVLVGILNGSFMFFADLVRELTIDCEVDFMKLSSYGDAKVSSGNVEMIKGLNCKVTGKDVLVVEDIVDSGLSMTYITSHIGLQNPASLRIVTLLRRIPAIRPETHVDYVGFEIPQVFVIGYGLDYAQRKRNLKAIYRLKYTGNRDVRREYATRNG